MYGSGLETLLDVREWSGDPLNCPGVVERPFQMSWMLSLISRSGRKTLRMSGSCQETLPIVRKW